MMKKYFLFLFITTVSIHAYCQSPDQKLQELGIVLPAASKPIANYVKYVRVGNLVYLSGHGPQKTDGSYITGKLGVDLTIDEGYAAARQTGINIIATLKEAIGDLSKVKRVIKVLGMVNCSDRFTDQPKVMNGFSDLMVSVFGEKGKHARSAVGMNSLPVGMCIEIEVIVEVE
jgi:enamine deaminase RidA (YjgF/YER057c/UK114 family)